MTTRRTRSKAATPPATPLSIGSPRGRRTTTRGGNTPKAARIVDESDTESRASNKSAGSSTTRDKLPSWLEKQLAQDIEQYGLHSIGVGAGKKRTLKQILDQGDERHYGTKSAPIRRTLGQKIRRWKELSREKYLLKLSKLGVVPFEARNKSVTETEAYREPKKEWELTSSDEEVEDKKTKEVPKFVDVKSPNSRDAVNFGGHFPLASPSFGQPPSPVIEESEPLEQSPPARKNSDVKMDPTKQHPRGSPIVVPIGVDIEWPENNREVLVFSTKDLPRVDKDDATLPGYYLLLPMQSEWVKKDLKVDCYKGRVLAANIVSLTVPAWDHDVINGSQGWEASNAPKDVKDSIQNARHEHYDSDTPREWVTFHLHFPSKHQLSSKEVFADAGEAQNLECDFLKVPINKKKTQFKKYAMWRVARLDVRGYKRGKIETEKAMSKNAQKLAALGLDSDDEEEEQEEENDNSKNGGGPPVVEQFNDDGNTLLFPAGHVMLRVFEMMPEDTRMVVLGLRTQQQQEKYILGWRQRVEDDRKRRGEEMKQQQEDDTAFLDNALSDMQDEIDFYTSYHTKKRDANELDHGDGEGNLDRWVDE
ncbi:unknown protein [Seminavis robusta]|uniref:Uncharacterized protein n=1 Tax=Seminavis robusta TaxID=568900 RepID=A0A9N8E1X5_9STRA|nr:unknown protein [Seminavis robusta]|eukprot:Sro462_g148030.1 n/a (591) ;mRNA; f:50860-52797